MQPIALRSRAGYWSLIRSGSRRPAPLAPPPKRAFAESGWAESVHVIELPGRCMPDSAEYLCQRRKRQPYSQLSPETRTSNAPPMSAPLVLLTSTGIPVVAPVTAAARESQLAVSAGAFRVPVAPVGVGLMLKAPRDKPLMICEPLEGS